MVGVSGQQTDDEALVVRIKTYRIGEPVGSFEMQGRPAVGSTHVLPNRLGRQHRPACRTTSQVQHGHAVCLAVHLSQNIRSLNISISRQARSTLCRASHVLGARMLLKPRDAQACAWVLARGVANFDHVVFIDVHRIVRPVGRQRGWVRLLHFRLLQIGHGRGTCLWGVTGGGARAPLHVLETEIAASACGEALIFTRGPHPLPLLLPCEERGGRAGTRPVARRGHGRTRRQPGSCGRVSQANAREKVLCLPLPAPTHLRRERGDPRKLNGLPLKLCVAQRASRPASSSRDDRRTDGSRCVLSQVQGDVSHQMTARGVWSVHDIRPILWAG